MRGALSTVALCRGQRAWSLPTQCRYSGAPTIEGPVTIRALPFLLPILLCLAWHAPSARAETLTAGDKALYRAAFKAAELDRWSDARKLAAMAKNKLPAKI